MCIENSLLVVLARDVMFMRGVLLGAVLLEALGTLFVDAVMGGYFRDEEILAQFSGYFGS